MKKNITLAAMLLFLPVIASAYAGMVDRQIQTMVNIRACSVPVIAVQIVLSILFFAVFRDCRINDAIHKVGDTVSESKKLAFPAFWILLAFCLTPYFGIAEGPVPFLSLLFAFPLMIILSIIVLFKKKREFFMSSRCLYYLIHIAAQQAIGYMVYLCVHDLEFFQNLFRYTDELYQCTGVFIYPSMEGLDDCAGEFLGILLFFIIPALVFLISEFISRKIAKRRSEIKDETQKHVIDFKNDKEIKEFLRQFSFVLKDDAVLGYLSHYAAPFTGGGEIRVPAGAEFSNFCLMREDALYILFRGDYSEFETAVEKQEAEKRPGLVGRFNGISFFITTEQLKTLSLEFLSGEKDELVSFMDEYKKWFRDSMAKSGIYFD